MRVCVCFGFICRFVCAGLSISFMLLIAQVSVLSKFNVLSECVVNLWGCNESFDVCHQLHDLCVSLVVQNRRVMSCLGSGRVTSYIIRVCHGAKSVGIDKFPLCRKSGLYLSSGSSEIELFMWVTVLWP